MIRHADADQNIDAGEDTNQSVKSYTRFRKLIDNSYEGISLLDKDLNIIYRSPSAARIGGWEKENRLKISIFELIHPDDRELFSAVIKNVLLNEEVPVQSKQRTKHFDGHYIWINVILTNYLNDPDIKAIVLNWRDITREKEAEDRLEASEKRFKALLENGAEGIVLVDIEKKPIYISPGFKRILGYSEEEAYQLNDIKIIHPDDFTYIRQKFIESINTPGIPVKDIIYRVLHKDGHWVYLNSTITNFLDDINIKGIVNNFIDVSEGKTLQNEQIKLLNKLKERNQYIEQILQNLPIGVVVNRLDKREIMLINKQFGRIFDYDIENMEDYSGVFKNLYPDDESGKAAAEKITHALNSGDPEKMTFDHVEISTSKGAKKIINLKMIPLYDQQLFITTMVDITLQASQDSELRRTKANQDAIINGTDNLIWSVDSGLRIIIANNRYLEFVKDNLGVDLKEGDDALLSEFGGELIERWRNTYQKVLKGEILTFTDQFFDKKFGKLQYGLVSLNPMYNEAGVVFGVSGSIKNTTNESLNLIELQRTKDDLEKIMNSSLDMICSVDNKGYLLSVSAACYNILGYLPSEMIGKNVLDFMFPDDQEATLQKIDLLMQGNDLINFENRYVRKDGSIVDLNWSSKWDPVHQMRYGAARDVTDKKKVERDLIESEKKYKLIFEKNPLPLLIWDFETFEILDINEEAELKYGYTREEFLKLTIKDIRPFDDINIVEHLTKNEASQGGSYKGTVRHKKKNGEIIFVNITGHLVIYKARKVILVLADDVTESRYFSKLDSLEKTVLEMNTRGDRSLAMLISEYLNGIEELHPGLLCSLLEKRGNRLYNMVSPNLSQEYLDFIDGVEIGENIGVCGSAAFFKRTVIAANIQEGAFSKEYKAITKSHGLMACWSQPIFDSGENVVATFACYYNEIKAPSAYEQKTIQRAVSILQIIFENFTRQKALELSNERFEYATEATSDVIWDWDLDTGKVNYSGNLNRLFGHKQSVDPYEQVFLGDYVHPEDRERVVMDLAQVKYGNVTKWEEEYRFKRANGEYAHVLEKALVLRDENGIGKRMVGAIQDITRQKLEERQLKLLESVVTNATDSIIITDAESLDIHGARILYVNEAFTKMTGFTSEDVIGKQPDIFQGPNTNKRELIRMEDALKRCETCEITVINYKKNGDEFWINFSVIPVADETGKYTHRVEIGRDVTEKQNAELQDGLLAEIRHVFVHNSGLKDCMLKTLEMLVEYGNITLAEVWLVDEYKNQIKLEAQFLKNKKYKKFANQTLKIAGLARGEGFPGITWDTQILQYWNYKTPGTNVRRYRETADAGFKRAYSLPLFYNEKVIGSLALLMDIDEVPAFGLSAKFESFSKSFGTEIKRKQLEDELNQVFNFTPDILCIANTDGYFIKVNPAMSTILEYAEQELLTRPFMEFVHPLDIGKTATELQNIIEGHPAYYIENRYITKSGKTKWLAWTTTGASEKGILFCSAMDVTAKKEVEDLLNKATSLARIGAWDVDLKKNIVHWSDITREIHEVAAGFEPDIKTATDFYPEGPHRQGIIKIMEAAADEGESGDEELQIITAKGNLKWVRVIAEAEFSGGNCTRLFGSFQDIDVRKKAELAAHEALEERNTILESIGDAFFAVNKEWIVSYWNNTAEKVLGKTKKEVLDQNLWQVFNESIGSESYKMYHEAIATRRPVHFEDYYPPLLKWYEISAYPSDAGLSVYFKDITDRKHAEKAILQLNENLKNQAKELSVSNAELEQFAYVASHDLQEPLRMVTSFLTQLEKKYGDVIDDKGKRYINFAVDGAKRMRQIILDLLEFSRVGNTDDDLAEIDLNKLVTEINILFKKQIQDEKATISFNNLPVIQSYKTPLRQVLQNLISNGLKYHKEGIAPVIAIKCEDFPTLWKFSVTDNGIGISQEYFEKIFIIFQRLHNKEEYSGTGMGLAIAKKIIENLGGKIWLTSALDKGSTFNFTILKNIKL